MVVAGVAGTMTDLVYGYMEACKNEVDSYQRNTDNSNNWKIVEQKQLWPLPNSTYNLSLTAKAVCNLEKNTPSFDLEEESGLDHW